MKHEELKLANQDNLNEAYCPLPLSAIPNQMGINLCSVESVAWAKQDDGQLVSLTINFNPEPKETANDGLAIGGNMTTEVVHSLVAECAESALTPTSPGSAVWEPQEHEYVLPHVGQPHSAFRETEGERRSRLSAQRIAQSSARLLQGN